MEPIEEAISTLRQAVLIWPQDRWQFILTTLQSGLAINLLILDEKLKTHSNRDEALTLFGRAVANLSPSGFPIGWARVSHERGRALLFYSTDPEMLAEAIAAFRRALTVRTQQNRPREWGSSAHFLGKARLALGEMQGLAAEVCEALTIQLTLVQAVPSIGINPTLLASEVSNGFTALNRVDSPARASCLKSLESKGLINSERR